MRVIISLKSVGEGYILKLFLLENEQVLLIKLFVM